MLFVYFLSLQIHFFMLSSTQEKKGGRINGIKRAS
nr:MAG TPA: LIGHT HARVESTING COMPLEX II, BACTERIOCHLOROPHYLL HARVESTING COMPLEX, BACTERIOCHLOROPHYLL, DEXTER [Caudoviricetes sp.]